MKEEKPVGKNPEPGGIRPPSINKLQWWFVCHQTKNYAGVSQNYLVEAQSPEHALDVAAKKGARYGQFRVFPVSSGVQFSVKDKVTHERVIARQELR